MTNSHITSNHERGVWAQRMVGSLENPAVRIESSDLTQNGVVGVGALDSRGIIIVGGCIGDTIAAKPPTSLSPAEYGGDGLVIFGGRTDIKVDGTVINQNARTAALIDGSDRGTIVVGASIGAGGSGLKVVVQGRVGADVQLRPEDRSTLSAPLGVSAPDVALPSVL